MKILAHKKGITPYNRPVVMQSRVLGQLCALHIYIPEQRMDVVGPAKRILLSYPISTSRFGLGSEPGSMKTPTGQFAIAETIGHGAECGMIFRSRHPIGQIGHEGEPDDYVQTRILWLAGLEPHNSNTKARYIYLHGTNHEQQLGEPTSHGCVRMRNTDIIELFALVKTGLPVMISAETRAALRKNAL